MEQPQRNQRIKVTRRGKGYEPGKTYIVVRVDTNDNTLVAADAAGQEGSWISWSQCSPAGPDISWEWLKSHLPGESLDLLSAFEGLEKLRLKDEVRDHILNQLPNLRERILQAQVALEEQMAAAGGAGTPGEADGNNDDDCVF